MAGNAGWMLTYLRLWGPLTVNTMAVGLGEQSMILLQPTFQARIEPGFAGRSMLLVRASCPPNSFDAQTLRLRVATVTAAAACVFLCARF